MPTSKGFSKGPDGKPRSRSDDVVPLAHIVDGLMRERVFSRGMPIAELASRWPEIVGERLARETAPTALDDGVLTVAVSTGPWGAQATFLHEEICRKADEALGGDRVSTVRITVRNAR
jgi:hypothetical protein